MTSEVIHYQHDGVSFKGYLAKPDSVKEKIPAILIAHAWRGQDDFARQQADELAKFGYVGFAIDLYGNDALAQDDEEALQLMLPLFLNRKLLRERLQAGLKTLEKHSFIDQNAIGAIGFCFGGLCVIELLRSGAAIKGGVSFHGLLGDTIGNHKAHLTPNETIKGSLLILHGYKDPLVSQSDIIAIQDEMTKAGVDWQMNFYGQAMHAFTNPQADDKNSGLVYNHRSADRAWRAMNNFFNEIFSQ